MNQVAIRAEGLSKQYRIGGGPRYKTLRGSLSDLMSAALRPWRHRAPETIWALRNVSFEVKSGEVVGVIGRNGSGKSTLLKILSRISEPTEGRVEIRGRVGSLLEVGTGFHPELNGRENIFLSGAILGMRRAEIDRKFDEIVAFAEVEKFIDTPVKHYSSGMYLRLAFAVAAHLEPEILLVDEVLAVGDAAFQAKCLGKMGDVAAEGRTVLFVSHNMPAVQRLSKQAFWLDQGRLRQEGTAAAVVESYMSSVMAITHTAALPPDPERPMRLRRIQIECEASGGAGMLEFSDPISVALVFDVNRVVTSSHVACFVSNADGVCVLGTGDADLDAGRLSPRHPGRYQASFQIPAKLLGEGAYSITVTMGKPYVEVYDRHEGIVSFRIEDHTSRRRASQHVRRPGILGVELPWDVRELSE